ncbi:hypothetical protein H5410_006078 [Solanum commersonii]|uniref:Ubiquitin-like domain-containing protein n=1 Tax=Solanum commersonii TaxID=4109 RepID=A0A9J6A969_SOLCO|nr:hypothetical protein H5410_006078 [Solanum commersonii]
MDGGDPTKTVKDDSGNIAGGGETVTINIRCVNDSKLSVHVSLNSTVGSFKSILSQMTDIPAEQQRVIYNGQILKDDQTLKSYGLEADHTVYLVRGFVAAASANATNVALSNTESSPEEFNIHMYENVQEPFFIATTMAGDTRNDLGTNPFIALLGAQEQGRNQSTNPLATGSDTTANPLAPNSNPLSNSWASADIGGAQMNTTPRSNAARNIWRSPLGGLDDLPDLQQMLGGIPNASFEN